MFLRLGLFLAGCLILPVLSFSARAESGSCYEMRTSGGAYVAGMLDDLIRKGKAFELPDGRVYAVFENLPEATICDLVGEDLSGLDLSGVSIEAEQLEGALLCDTTLPDGRIARSGCE
ncbi:hypothetical protein [Roseibium sp.]|uniref:hypothetical protein n=1 Tax=Roseibium sp. TaxID=1936156 RepID=UPI003A9805D7